MTHTYLLFANRLICKLTCICTLAWCTACSKSSEPIPQPESDKITIATNSLSFSYEGGEQQLAFTTTQAWQISWDDQEQEWCSTSQSEGSKGSVTLTISTSLNPKPESRSTTLILTAGNAREEVTIKQEAQTQAHTPVDTDENEEYTGEDLDWDQDMYSGK